MFIFHTVKNFSAFRIEENIFADCLFLCLCEIMVMYSCWFKRIGNAYCKNVFLTYFKQTLNVHVFHTGFIRGFVVQGTSCQVNHISSIFSELSFFHIESLRFIIYTSCIFILIHNRKKVNTKIYRKNFSLTKFCVSGIINKKS